MAIPYFFRLGQSETGISADFIDALVVNNLGFGATSSPTSVSAASNGGVALWNPAASNANLLLYGFQMSTDTGGTQLLVATITADPGWTTVAALAKHRKSSGGASAVGVMEVSTNAGSAPAAATVTDSHILGTVPYQYGDGLADVFLRPGTGVKLFLSSPTAGAFKFAVNLDWMEFSDV